MTVQIGNPVFTGCPAFAGHDNERAFALHDGPQARSQPNRGVRNLLYCDI
jgi:hypothetical protein